MHILITAGPTREAIDPVRYITNPSSGKMGFAVARAARRRGHRVTLVTGPVRLRAPRGVKTVRVVTAQHMSSAVLRAQQSADCLIATAAVGDFRPAAIRKTKIKKTRGALTLRFVPNPDILLEVAKRWRRGGRNKILIGFALESHEGLRHAQRKLQAKKLDAVVLNQPDSFQSQLIHATLLRPDCKPLALKRLSKAALATRLVRLAEQLLSK